MKMINVGIYFIVIIFLGLVTFAYCIRPGVKTNYQSEWLKKNKTSSFQFEGANIHYYKKGIGQNIILLHGGGTWLYSYRNNIDKLAENYCVYAIDLPGHGYSQIPKGYKYNFSDIMEIIDSFYEYEGIKKATIVGNSWGGGWAIYFAERRKDKVEKLILIDSSGLKNSNEYDKSIWSFLNYPLIGEIIIHFITEKSIRKSFEEELFYDKKKINEKITKEVYKPLTFSHNLSAQIQYQRNLKWKDTGYLLNQINVPTLIIWGKEDKYLPVEMAYEYKKIIPKSELVIFDKAGHLVHEELSDEVNDLILDFMGK